MNIFDFIVFLVFDSIIHHFMIKWEIKTNKDLFIDLEIPPKYHKYLKSNNK